MADSPNISIHLGMGRGNCLFCSGETEAQGGSSIDLERNRSELGLGFLSLHLSAEPSPALVGPPCSSRFQPFAVRQWDPESGLATRQELPHDLGAGELWSPFQPGGNNGLKSPLASPGLPSRERVVSSTDQLWAPCRYCQSSVAMSLCLSSVSSFRWPCLCFL